MNVLKVFLDNLGDKKIVGKVVDFEGFFLYFK